MKTCEGCGKGMYFLTTKAGKPIPVNAETVSLIDRIILDNGRAVQFAPKDKGHIAHFTDCPKADRFRKPKEKEG